MLINPDPIMEIPIMIDGVKKIIEFSRPLYLNDDFDIKLESVKVIERMEERIENKIILKPNEVEVLFLVRNPKTGKVKKKWFYGKVKGDIELNQSGDNVTTLKKGD